MVFTQKRHLAIVFQAYEHLSESGWPGFTGFVSCKSFYPEYPDSDNLDKAQYRIGVAFEYLLFYLVCKIFRFCSSIDAGCDPRSMFYMKVLGDVQVGAP